MEHANKRLGSIQVVRALACLCVIGVHIRFLSFSSFAVDLFFCISGFMVMFSTEKTSEHFLLKRWIRIAPLYYILTFFLFGVVSIFPSLFEHTQGEFSHLVKSLFFIPFDVGQGYIQPLVRIGWTLNCEVFFYLLFWISFHISHKYRGFLVSLFLLVVVMMHPYFDQNVILSFWSNSVMLEFIWGILCFYGYRWITSFYQEHPFYFTKGRGFALVGLGLFTLIFMSLNRVMFDESSLLRFLFWGMSSAFIVIAFVVAGFSISMNRILVLIGDMSYSIYLLHYYPIQLFDRMIFDFSTLRLDSLFGCLLALILVFGLSYISYDWIEKKLGNYLLKKMVYK